MLKEATVSFTDPNEPVPAELRTGEFVLRPIAADDMSVGNSMTISSGGDHCHASPSPGSPAGFAGGVGALSRLIECLPG
jgi:hypothetical protein